MNKNIRDFFKKKEIFEKIYTGKFLFVKDEEREKVHALGAKYNTYMDMYYIEEEQNEKPFSAYLKENNPNPIYRELRENISNEDFMQKVNEHLSQRGFTLKNEVVDYNSAKWIKIYRDGSTKPKGGIKIYTNECEITKKIQPYKNVLLFNDWTNAKGSEVLSANDLFQDSKFISQQIGIALWDDKKEYYRLSKEEQETASLWKKYDACITYLHKSKQVYNQKEEELLRQLGHNEILNRFKSASFNIDEIKSHEYIKNKQLPIEYVGKMRIDNKGLLIPLVTGGIGEEKPKFSNIQRIVSTSEGLKKLYGIEVSKEDKELGIEKYVLSSKGVYFIASKNEDIKFIKDLPEDKPIVLVEGASTAIFLSKALEDLYHENYPIVASMSIGGMRSLLEEIKRLDSMLLERVIVSPDNDEHKIYTQFGVNETKNVGVTNGKTYVEEYGVKMIVPQFDFVSRELLMKDKPSDWEDLYNMNIEQMKVQTKVFQSERNQEEIRNRNRRT